MKRLRKISAIFCISIISFTSCVPKSPARVAPFVYLSGDRNVGHSFIEYYPDEELKLNSYNDGKRLYLSLGHALFVYDSVSKKVIELDGYETNALKKIGHDVWVALDKGMSESGYSTSLCKLSDDLQFDCVYEARNQQITDFYFDFDQEVFYGAGPGISTIHDGGEYKVVKYNMRTGEETEVQNNGDHIIAGRLTNICPGEFITSDADIYSESGEKVGEVIGANGTKLKNQINDLINNETTFLDYDNNLLEVYGCENNKVKHKRTINLTYGPRIYPAYHSKETTDEGEISMPIAEIGEIFEYIGFQSVNLRTGEVQVHLFDERVHMLHAVARFV